MGVYKSVVMVQKDIILLTCSQDIFSDSLAMHKLRFLCIRKTNSTISFLLIKLNQILKILGLCVI